ncbi:MAG TPA: autorepressor SdpR family transcription factor [Spirochaetales bacterium]|nr:autorepressor SdpR family transcription factor [Spirochaetales bacterium]HRY54180.1 autorepressor SdpR family transcription factor [Spirochaetia bacterium]
MNEVFKALSDPTRRRILELLKEGNRSAGQIAEAFPIGKPAVSHHLALLKAADLVQSEREGQSIIYSLNTTVFQELLSWVYKLRGTEAEPGNAFGGTHETR